MGERLLILGSIERGEISVEEGARRLAAAAKSPELPALTTAPRPAVARWLWQAAFWVGVALAAWGGWLLASSCAGEVAATGRLVWAWLIFVLGILGMMLGWWLQRARWLYVRVRQADGPNVTIALPLPLGLVAWGMSIAQFFVPRLDEIGVDELLLAMEEELRKGYPFVVKVDDEDGGRVQVCFG